MKTPCPPSKHHGRLAGVFSTFLLMLLLAASVSAQSTDIGYPTPIRSNEISGTIAPRDLGDPRLTRYFYSFTGTPGDLIISVESRNLEGDVDVFTAGTLRPLDKVSLYAGGTSPGGSKTIYLRTRQSLILRVEARTPNDNEGSFRVRFAGTFEPISSDIPDPEPIIPTLSSTSSADKKARRVTATGARIEEPEPVVAATTEPETTAPAAPTTEPPAPAETPATTAEVTKPQPEKPKPAARTRRPRTPRTRRNRPTPTARKVPTPTAQPAAIEPASGPRLIIETRDGMRVERYMTTVRRVTVERGQIVVVMTDGKIERQPLSNVLRMAIEP